MNDQKLEIILSAKDLTQRAFTSASARVQKFTSNVFSMRGALVAAAGVAAMGAFVKKSMETADAIGKAADAIGISTGILQEYRHAARISGVQTEALDKSIGQFAKRVGEARAGTGAMITFLKQFDENLLKNIQSSKSTDEALGLVFKRMGQTASATDKAALANAAFGRSGLTMVNMVKDGAEGLVKMRQEARDLGIVMSDHLIRQSERANDEIEKLTRVMKVQFTSAAVGLAPEIAKIAKSTTDWWKANRDLSDSLVISAHGTASATKWVLEYGSAWIKTIQALGLASAGQISLTQAMTDGIAAVDEFNQANRRYSIDPDTKGWEIYKPSGGGSGGGSGSNKADLAEYKSLMKELEKAQQEFQNALVVPSGTGALVEEQLRTEIGKYVVGYDSIKEDIEKSKQAYSAMFSDLRFQGAGYYDWQKEQLQAQADAYTQMTGNHLLSRQWLDEQLKQLDAERLAAVRESSRYLIDLSQRTSDAMEDNFSSFFKDFFRRDLDSAEDYFNAFCNSLLDSYADMMGQMAKESIFGKGGGGGGLLDFGIGLLTSWLGGGATVITPSATSIGGGGWVTIPKGHAKGGSFGSDEFIRVGEEGPEIIYTGSNSGQVIPNSQITGEGVSMQVNVINESGTPLSAEQGEIRFDGKKYIADVHVDRLMNSRAYRQSNQQALR